MAGEVACETRAVAVRGEAFLNRPFLQRPSTAAEDRPIRAEVAASAKLIQQSGRDGEKRSLGPSTALESLHHDAAAREIDVAPDEEGHFPDSKAIVVDQREESAITKARDHAEECFDFRLSEVSRKPLEGRYGMRQRVRG